MSPFWFRAHVWPKDVLYSFLSGGVEHYVRLLLCPSVENSPFSDKHPPKLELCGYVSDVNDSNHVRRQGDTPEVNGSPGKTHVVSFKDDNASDSCHGWHNREKKTDDGCRWLCDDSIKDRFLSLAAHFLCLAPTLTLLSHDRRGWLMRHIEETKLIVGLCDCVEVHPSVSCGRS